MPKNASNSSLKNDINEYGYLAICLPKIGITTLNLACYTPRYASTTYFTDFEILKIWDFLKWLYKNLGFSFLESQKNPFLENKR